MKLSNNLELPLGFGMALMQNTNAMNYFASLTVDQQKAIINQTHMIKSKQEMQQFVEKLIN